MSDERRKSVWPWAAVVLALPVMYELSLGPLVSLLSRDAIPGWCQPAVSIYLIPTNFVYNHAPEPVQRVMSGYVGMWTFARPPHAKPSPKPFRRPSKLPPGPGPEAVDAPA